MSGSVMFADEEKRASIKRWYDTFRERIASPTTVRTIETSFGKTHALVGGPEDGAPLVLLHGALASSAHVMIEVESLLKTRRVYALDVIGQSVMSEDRRIDLDGDDYGRWVDEATKALGLDRFDLYGVSWGGFVAMRTAAAIPERVKKLVLMVPAGWVANGFWAGLRDAGYAVVMYRTFPSEKRLERTMKALFSEHDDQWKRYFGEALLAYKMDMRVPPLMKPPHTAKVTMPTLVFGAEHDSSFPGAALLARVKALIPQAEVELLEGAKHSPPMNEAFRAKIGARIERFLGSAAT